MYICIALVIEKSKENAGEDLYVTFFFIKVEKIILLNI